MNDLNVVIDKPETSIINVMGFTLAFLDSRHIRHARTADESKGAARIMTSLRQMFWLGPPAPKVLGSYTPKTSALSRNNIH